MKKELLYIDYHYQSKMFFITQIIAEMEEKQISKSELARKMKTSRSALERLLDPKKPTTLKSLERLANALGLTLKIKLIEIPMPVD
jgi:transcriptional regulator with XRE-family HTH domain